MLGQNGSTVVEDVDALDDADDEDDALDDAIDDDDALDEAEDEDATLEDEPDDDAALDDDADGEVIGSSKYAEREGRGELARPPRTALS